MTISNKSIARANRTLAKITRKLPVNITVTKKPSKLETAISIVAGIACYAYGIGMMMKATEPSYYIPMPTITPVMPEPKADVLKLLDEMCETKGFFVSPHGCFVNGGEDIFSTPAIIDHGVRIDYQFAGNPHWESEADPKIVAKVQQRIKSLRNELGGDYHNRK